MKDSSQLPRKAIGGCSAAQLRPYAVEPDKWLQAAWQGFDHRSAAEHDRTFAVEHEIVNLDAF
jgi:hypothetical protein